MTGVQTCALPISSVYSVLLFGDKIPLSGWLGIAVIVASGIAATVLRSWSLPDTPAEDH